MIHGVDSLGQLRAARLVDTACVYPDPFVPLGFGVAAAFPDLGGSPQPRIVVKRIAFGMKGVKVLKRLFAISPYMRKNRVLWRMLGEVRTWEVEIWFPDHALGEL